MFLLDTNVISELRKAPSGKADPNVTRWAARTPAGDMFLSSISILEAEQGVLRMERHDMTQGKMLRRWLEDYILPAFADRIFPVDIEVARRCARLHVPDPRSYRDSLIAATAQVHNLTVVTRNLVDFEPIGIALVNPWNA